MLSAVGDVPGRLNLNERNQMSKAHAILNLEVHVHFKNEIEAARLVNACRDALNALEENCAEVALDVHDPYDQSLSDINQLEE